MELLCQMSCHAPQTDYLDVVAKIAAILIAVSNIYLVYFIHKSSSKKTDEQAEKNRQIELFKSLILDHSLKYFYEYFESLEQELNKLNSTKVNKQEIVDNTDELFADLRRKFYNGLLAVDQDLYDGTLKLSDDLQGLINSNIFDAGINLTHNPMFEEKILNPLENCKSDILSLLFRFKG